MNDAATRYSTFTPKPAYPANAAPATLAMPLVMMQNSSWRLSWLTKGFAAAPISFWPRKIVVTAQNDSILETPSNF